jgi:hypothetical protein
MSPAVRLDELGKAQCPHCGREGPADPGYQLCIECSRWFVVEDAVVLADGGREREGQRTLEDARWHPDQQTLEDVGEDDDIDRGEGIETDGGEDLYRLSDPLNVIAVDACDYPSDRIQHTCRVSTDLLQRATTIIDQLDWSNVDLYTVEPAADWDADEPALLIHPSSSGKQAGIVIAPKVNIPDCELVSDEGEDDDDIQCDGGTRQLVDPLGWPPHRRADPLGWPPRGDQA